MLRGTEIVYIKFVLKFFKITCVWWCVCVLCVLLTIWALRSLCWHCQGCTRVWLSSKGKGGSVAAPHGGFLTQNTPEKAQNPTGDLPAIIWTNSTCFFVTAAHWSKNGILFFFSLIIKTLKLCEHWIMERWDVFCRDSGDSWGNISFPCHQDYWNYSLGRS